MTDPLPAWSELFLLPGREPIGFDARRRLRVLGDVGGRQTRAVAAFLAPAHTQYLLPAYRRRESAPVLPLFAYTAVAFLDGGFAVPGVRVVPDLRQEFTDREQTVTADAAVVEDPSLPAGADFTPPWVTLALGEKQAVDDPQVHLGIAAAPDAQRMLLREWTPDPVSGAWTVAQNSGWID